MDRGAWRATVHGVTKGGTQLKLLSTQGWACSPWEGGLEWAAVTSVGLRGTLLCLHALYPASIAFLQLAWGGGAGGGKVFFSSIKLRSLPSPLWLPAHSPPTLAGTWGVSFHGRAIWG